MQIIQPESHPNAFNQGPGTSGAKESLSIYGLFQNHAKTPQGKIRLRQAFLRPSLEIDEINARLDFISVFVRPDNQSAREKLSKNLSKVKNMRNTITLLRKGIDSGKHKQTTFKSSVWASLLDFCFHTIEIADTLRQVLGADHLSLCVRAADVLDRHSLLRVGRTVEQVVDLDSSSEQYRTVVKRGVHEELDKVKDTYNGIDEILSEVTREIARKVPLALQKHVSLVFIPRMGFLITVPIDESKRQPVYDGAEWGWQHMFNTHAQSYFKDDIMHQMDQELGDLYSVICDIEVEIAYDLAQEVLTDKRLLVAASDLCGELDYLLAFTHVACQYNLTRPKITEENIINIKGGRHLLQEMSVPSFVPNDTFLVGGNGQDHNAAEPSMILLTGPNYSGKSVYQKQVALAVYMAQMGTFLPAESATIGITDKILTRITTRETVSKVQSAFVIDMQQIAMALNSCTRKSLVVIDEFGKGTNTCDGAGLAAAVFHHLLSLGAESPKTLVATHFHEIFDLGLFNDMRNISFAHMEVRVDGRDHPSAKEPKSQVTYLYNLRPGRSDLSYGTQCAAVNGVPVEVVDRAVELARLSLQGEDLVAICSALSVVDADDLGFAESAARIFLSGNFDQEMTKEELLTALEAILEVETVTDEVTISG